VSKAYVFVGSHADTLGNGRPIGPGEEIDATDVDLDDPYNQALIENGILADKPEPAPDAPEELKGEALEKRIAELGIEGTSSMTAAEKRAAVAEAEAEATNEGEGG
jgi:hypothetical protein